MAGGDKGADLAAAVPDERRVWELLVRDFEWTVPAQHIVSVRQRAGDGDRPSRLQIFEMAATTVLAHLRPEFAWFVTENRPDHGIDFVGVQQFLDDDDLGIAAAITVGGQCKKRERVDEIVGELAGPLLSMAEALDPTFFVVALSARLDRERVQRARRTLERQLNRHVHIFDRDQIEGLIGQHLDVVIPILSLGLESSEVGEVLRYFEAHSAAVPPPTVTVTAERRVLAGIPFAVKVDIRWALASSPDARLRWRPSPDLDGSGAVTLIGPVGGDSPDGVPLVAGFVADDPLRASCQLDLLTYAVGTVDLGTLEVGFRSPDVAGGERLDLGAVEVVETMRPRFFDRPYRTSLERLDGQYRRALSGFVSSVAVVGPGGSGKSRLCEEFAIEQRRHGAVVVSVKQIKTHEAAHRFVADLLLALADRDVGTGDPADGVIEAVAQYDRSLADRAEFAVRSVVGTRRTNAVDGGEQSLISVVLVLLAARARTRPLILHLQDLHWCSADTLQLLERIAWQLNQLKESVSTLDGHAPNGVLLLFEGRVREEGPGHADSWSSASFEAFLDRVACPIVRCPSLSRDDGRAFVRLLFEGRHSAHRLADDGLLPLQEEVMDLIDAAAGGNPFHTLEQARLLKDLKLLGRNPLTGLLYLIRADFTTLALPDTVFESIELRWQYIKSRAPELAHLIWGCALIEDRIPAGLFRHLWSDLAPDVSLKEIESTDMLWTGDGDGRDVVFRHENYFRTLRRFTVPVADRRRVVNAYVDWFSSLPRPTSEERFRWARVILEDPEPDLRRVTSLLRASMAAAAKRGDARLVRQVRSFSLDLAWERDERAPYPVARFRERCDEEISLCRELLGTDRTQAASRLARLRTRLDSRVQRHSPRPDGGPDDFEVQRQTVATIEAQVLFNDTQPEKAAELAGRVVDHARRHRGSEGSSEWRDLEMEALYTRSCGEALSGDFGAAVRSSDAAASIAKVSSSPLARKVLSTCGTMLLSEDPARGERVLRSCLATWPDDDTSDSFLVHVHLCMALILQAYVEADGLTSRTERLAEARDRSTSVHHSCRQLGLAADAGAAALVRGVVSAFDGEGDQATWFALGVAAAGRARQMETLWRSHLNLATSVWQRDGFLSETCLEHAEAAAAILTDTLSQSAPEESPRFHLVRVGLARTTWMLAQADSATSTDLFARFPSLRSDVTTLDRGGRVQDGADRHYQWLEVGGADYILY
jgi:hypothetical protein